MSDVFMCLLFSAIALILIVCVGIAIAMLTFLGGSHPEIGIPVAIFLWMAGAWIIHYHSKR